MTENLIESIKKSEKVAAEIIQKAESDAQKRLKEIDDLYKDKSEILRERFKQERKDIVKKANEEFIKENEDGKRAVEKEIKLINENAKMNKENVIEYIIKKIID